MAPDPTYLPPAAAAAKLFQLRPTLCDPIDGSPSGSTIPGILQARTMEWVATAFSSIYLQGCKKKKKNLISRSSDGMCALHLALIPAIICLHLLLAPEGI